MPRFKTVHPLKVLVQCKFTSCVTCSFASLYVLLSFYLSLAFILSILLEENKRNECLERENSDTMILKYMRYMPICI